MTVEKLVELQRTDEELKPLFAFLKERKLPNTNSESRRLVSHIDDYIIKDSFLFYVPPGRRPVQTPVVG